MEMFVNRLCSRKIIR